MDSLRLSPGCGVLSVQSSLTTGAVISASTPTRVSVFKLTPPWLPLSASSSYAHTPCRLPSSQCQLKPSPTRHSLAAAPTSSQVDGEGDGQQQHHHHHQQQQHHHHQQQQQQQHHHHQVGQPELGISTRILHFKGGSQADPFNAVSTPIYQTATFKQDSATENSPYDYTRSGNPTRHALEEVLADVEGAHRAFAFTTGMAALAAATRLVEHGQSIVAGDDIYGGTDRLLSRVVPRAGVEVRRVDTTDLSAVRAAIDVTTRLVIMESPTNPRQRISDIKAIADMAHTAGALLLVDNSILSPVLSRPLSLGADLVMHSATKFIAGHSDVMAGVLAVKDEKLAREVYFVQNAEGGGLSPFDSWLCLRGLKTMALRIERQQASAQKIAEFLLAHERVESVYYAGLKDHPGRELHFAQAKGAGSVLSFTTGSIAASKHIVENTRLANIAVSFGSVSTSISLPCFMSHASIPAEVRKERGLVEDLVRLSVGIEDVEDLIADLSQAISSAPF